MKHALIALFALALSSQAFAATLKIDCHSESDPDYMDVTIYQQDNGKLFAFVQEYYGDGDSYDEDIIEMERIQGNDAVVFVQVPGKHPRSKLAPKATGKVKGAVLRVVYPEKGKDTSDGSLVGLISPSGNGTFAEEGLTCKRIGKIEGHK